MSKLSDLGNMVLEKLEKPLEVWISSYVEMRKTSDYFVISCKKAGFEYYFEKYYNMEILNDLPKARDTILNDFLNHIVSYVFRENPSINKEKAEKIISLIKEELSDNCKLSYELNKDDDNFISIHYENDDLSFCINSFDIDLRTLPTEHIASNFLMEIKEFVLNNIFNESSYIL